MSTPSLNITVYFYVLTITTIHGNMAKCKLIKHTNFLKKYAGKKWVM